MENPLEELQSVLLSRMIGNIDKLNEGFLEFIKSLQQINSFNYESNQLISLWISYYRNVKFNLEASRFFCVFTA